jgi:mRNA interferase RelE/StbE
VTYTIELNRRAIKDLRDIAEAERRRIVARIEALADDLAGDVKRLTHFTPEYRLRVGDYRVLFEVDGNRVVVHRVKHRSDAYS